MRLVKYKEENKVSDEMVDDFNPLKKAGYNHKEKHKEDVFLLFPITISF